MNDTKFVAPAPKGADCGIDYPVTCPECGGDGWLATSHSYRCDKCKGTGKQMASVIEAARKYNILWKEFLNKLEDEVLEYKARRRNEFREQLKNAGY